MQSIICDFDKIFFRQLDKGEKIAYRKLGDGKNNILWIHGDQMSSYLWKFFLPYLELSQSTYYFIDLRGYGHSSYNKPITSIKNFSDDVDEFVNSLQIQNPIMFGYSLGGAVVQQLASLMPEKYSKFILVSPLGSRGLEINEEFTDKELRKQKLLDKYSATINSYHQRSIQRKISETIPLYTKLTQDPQELNKVAEELFLQRNFPHLWEAVINFNISSFYGGDDISKQFNGQGYIIWSELELDPALNKVDQIFVDMPLAKIKVKTIEKMTHLGILEYPQIYMESYNQFLQDLLV